MRSSVARACAVVSTGCGYAAALFTLPFALGVIAVRRLSGFSPRVNAWVRFGAAFIPASFGISVRVRGLHRLPKTRPLLIISNHVNIFDGFVLGGHLPLEMRALELESHFRWPVYGLAMRLYGNIPVPHYNPQVAVGRLRRMRAAMQGGACFLTFPEGHRTRTGAMGRFMSGAFRIACDMACQGMPIAVVPVAMIGLYERQRVGSLRVTPGRVEIRIGTPVSAAQLAGLTPRALADHVRAEMGTLGAGS